MLRLGWKITVEEFEIRDLSLAMIVCWGFIITALANWTLKVWLSISASIGIILDDIVAWITICFLDWQISTEYFLIQSCPKMHEVDNDFDINAIIVVVILPIRT